MLADYNICCPICGGKDDINEPVELGSLNEQNLPLRSLPVTCKEHGTKFVSYIPGQAPGESEIQIDLNRQFALSR